MADVFTFYCHGTGAARDHNENTEIVNVYAHKDKGKEFETKLILDGVGKAPKDVNHPMAGEFEYDATAISRKKKISTKSAAFAAINGSGVKGNVKFAMEVFNNEANKQKNIKTVNMIGWSRGAVTCIRLANKIVEENKNIEINIFAVDPVVGGEDKGFQEGKSYNYTVPKAVKNLVVILATGEKRTKFAPQDASRLTLDPATNAMFLPLSGVHDTVAKKGNPGLDHVSNVVFSMAGQFLRNFGTPVEPDKSLTDAEYLQQYAGMMLKSEEYATIRSQKGGTTAVMDRFSTGYFTFHKRAFASNLERYVMNPDFFINQHHRRCFKSIYPNLFTFLFKKSKDPQAIQALIGPVEAELASLSKNDDLYHHLRSITVTETENPDKNTKLYLMPQKGVYVAKEERFCYKGSLKKMGILQADDAKPNDEPQ